MLKIFQAKLQQYMNYELPDVQAGFRKGRGTRDQIIKNAREFQKNIYFCFIDYAKAFDCVDHNKLWKILKKMGIPDHLTCLLVSGPITSWQIVGETMETVADFIFGGSKSLQMVIAAMKLKDAYSLEEKL